MKAGNFRQHSGRATTANSAPTKARFWTRERYRNDSWKNSEAVNAKATEIELADWDGIRDILDALRSAFHKVDHDLLVYRLRNN